MSLRRQVLEVLQAVFGFGKIAKSSGHDVYDVDGEIGEATTPECERWGDAAVLSRPPAGAECKYIQLGDERVVIGTRDRRYTVTVAEGEVVVRAMGPGSPAYVRLRPNGTCEIIGAQISLTSATANQPFMRGTATHTYLDGVIAAMSTAIGGVPTAGSALKTAFDGAITALAVQKTATLSTKIRGD